MQGQHIPGFKPYIQVYPRIETGWKVKELFDVDVGKIIDWYEDLETNWQDWKFIHGKHAKKMWKMDICDPTGKTGHILPDDSAWYILCQNSDKPGPFPPEQSVAHPDYKDDDNDELNPRKNFYGYGLDIVENLSFKSKKWMVTIHTPGTKLITHQDSPDKFRVHIPIETNDESFWIIDGEEFHMKPGKVYLVNTSLPHSVENKGDTNRIHLYGKVWARDICERYNIDIPEELLWI